MKNDSFVLCNQLFLRLLPGGLCDSLDCYDVLHVCIFLVWRSEDEICSHLQVIRRFLYPSRVCLPSIQKRKV